MAITLSGDGIARANLAADVIDGTKIEDDAVGTEHLANAINTDIAAKLPLAGGTMSGDLILEDNVKIELGNASGGDLQIYHNASNSYISDQGTGHLKILGTHIVMMNAAEDKNYLYATDGDSVALYFNNAAKLATSNTGVTVTGVLAATTLTGDGSALTGMAGGVTEADQWRLTTSFTANADPIASNWERNDTAGFGLLGTGMTQSSGIFTFPSTGYWHVGFQCLAGTAFGAGSHTQGCWAEIKATTNNSSYVGVASNQQGAYNFNTSYFTGMSIYCEAIVDVTSTTNVKVQFNFGAGQGGESCRGSSQIQQTGVTFIRLGDT